MSVIAVSDKTSIPLGQSSAVYAVDASSKGFLITVPDAVADDGTHFYIKRLDLVAKNPVAIITGRRSGQKIDGLSSIQLTKHGFYHLLACNGNWSTVA